MRWIQFLISNHVSLDGQEPTLDSQGRMTAAAAHDPVPQVEQHGSAPQMLETIVEGTDEDGSSNAPSLLVYDQQDDELFRAGQRALHYLMESTETDIAHDITLEQNLDIEDRRRPDFNLFPGIDEPSVAVPDPTYHVKCANQRANLPIDT